MSHINQEFANSPSLYSSRVSNRSNRSRGITVITSQVPISSTMERLLQELPIQQHSFQNFDHLPIDRSDQNHRQKSELINEVNIFSSHERPPQEKAKMFDRLDSSFMSGSTMGRKSVMAETYRFQNHRPSNVLDSQRLNQSFSVHPNQERNRPQTTFMTQQDDQRPFSELFKTFTKPPSQIDGYAQKPPHIRPSPLPISSLSVSSHQPIKIPKLNEFESVGRNRIQKNPGYKRLKQDGTYTCACKKDMCLTKYCGCAKNGLKCSQSCNCFSCLNYVGAPQVTIAGKSRKKSVFSPSHYYRVEITPIKSQRQPNCSLAQIWMPCLGLGKNESAGTTKKGSQKESSQCSEILCTEFKMELLDIKSIAKINQCYDTEPDPSRIDKQ